MNFSYSNKENYQQVLLLLSSMVIIVKLRIILRLNKLLAMPASVSTKKGKKDIFGVYIFFGKENKADWMKVFDDLITRGILRERVL